MQKRIFLKKISQAIKNSTVTRHVLSYLAYGFFSLLCSTYKLVVVDKRSQKEQNQQNGVFYFWHQNLIGCVLFFTRHLSGINCIVSPSNDGKMAGFVCNKLGFNVLYGSSFKSPVALIKKTLRSLTKNPSLFVVGDGSRGPIFKLQPGIAKLAEKSNLPLIFVECSASSAFTIKKSWDQFKIPKPFSTITITINPPANSSQ